MQFGERARLGVREAEPDQAPAASGNVPCSSTLRAFGSMTDAIAPAKASS
jgi:hypothetical protein